MTARQILLAGYRILLYGYPADFRRRFGPEMVQVFGDRCAETAGVYGLLRLAAHTLGDWFISAIHERMEKAGNSTQRLAAVSRDGVPAFHMTTGEMPRTGALLHGGILAIGAFGLFSFLMGHGGTPRPLLIGSHHPSRSHILPATTSAAPSDLHSEVAMKPYPEERPLSPYFRLIFVLGALDADHDGIISASEIANAPAALRTLDRNQDGKLSAQECGDRFGMPRPEQSAARLLPRARIAFMRDHPVLAALDADHDGEISQTEIGGSSAALRTLDRNCDGRLTEDEVIPLK